MQNACHDKANSAKQPTHESPDLATYSKIYANNDKNQPEDDFTSVEDDIISNVDDKVRKVKKKSKDSQDVVKISTNQSSKKFIVSIQYCETDENLSVLKTNLNNANDIRDKEANDKERILSHKDIIELPVSYNTVTIHGTHFDAGTETQAEEGYIDPKSNKNALSVRKLVALIPPPAFPDTSIPRLHDCDLKSRNEFIKFVLIMVLIMIIITALSTVYVLITPEVKLYFNIYGWQILLPAILLLALADCGMICSLCARSAPWNFIYSALTVIPMSLLAAKISVFFNTEVVVYAILSTGVVVFICILLTCSTFDFTKWITFVLLIAFSFAVVTAIIIVIAAITGKMMQPLSIATLYGSTLFQVVMFTIQLQMVLGKNSLIQVGVEDYCLAAFLLYTSILDVCIRTVHIYALAKYN